jgi:hypothetical protein
MALSHFLEFLQLMELSHFSEIYEKLIGLRESIWRDPELAITRSK